MHLAGALLWLPLALLLKWADAHYAIVLASLAVFGTVHQLFAPRCPRCGTNVYITKKTRWFAERYSWFTRRCSQCGLVWSEE